MSGHFAGIIAGLCSPDGLGLALLPGLFLAGLAGSVMHCGPMCGPFVLGQVADRLARLPAASLCEAARVRSGLLLPYHFGRITTYCLLGALAGAAGEMLRRLSWLGPVGGVMLLVAALLFLSYAAARVAPSTIGALLPSAARAPARWMAAAGRLTRRVDRTRAAGGYLLGVVLGFLPCGFLYAALAAASAAGGPARGAAAMAMFGLGTAPVLGAIGVAGQAASRGTRPLLARAAPAILLFNATLLGVMAWQMLTG